ncbi:hypothetical protein [Planctomycetes bacterium Pan216]
MVRNSLHEAAVMWIREFLPLKFLPGNSQRYTFARRSRKTLEIKKRAKFYRPFSRNKFAVKVPAAEPRISWIRTGTTRDLMTKREASSFNIKKTATSSKQTVRVPLKLGHPINPKNVGEISEVLPSETRDLQRRAKTTFVREFDAETLGNERFVINGRAA